MPISAPQRSAFISLWRDHCHQWCKLFRSNADGAAAVEFALVSLPFVAVIAMTIQVGLIMWATQNLEENLQRAARTIYTGDFQTANSSQKNTGTLLSNLKDSMCGTSTSRVPTVFDCNNVRFDVSLSTSFSAGSVPSPLSAQTQDWSSGFGSKYTCATPGAIVVVTAAVKYPIAFSFLNFGAASFADGSRLIQATAVFRTEPYDTSSGSPC